MFGVAGSSSGAGHTGGAGKAGSLAAGGGGNAGGAGTGTAGMAGDDSDAGVMPTAGSGSAAPRSTGPGDWMAGDYPDALDSGNWLEISGVQGQKGNVRQYRVHVPPQYDPKTPMPLLFCIHGLGQDGILFCVDGTGMPAKSDAAGFLLVMPNGYDNSWNAGTCCGDAVTEGLDDVALFRAIFAEVSKHLNIDLPRVYATGLSNGGYMSYRLACEASDLFVAVAPGAGAIGMADIGGGTSTTSDIKACAPVMPVSVLDIHGTEDPLIPFSTQKPSLDRIAMGDGCQTMTHPAMQPVSTGDVTCVSYDCQTGVDVTGCSVKGGGHVWFGSPNCGTGVDAACSIVGNNSDDIMNTDAVWTFLSAHSRP
jgi:polyhydroxybutyrate depolymerase